MNAEKVKKFTTYKCKRCGNVMRDEFSPDGNHQSCNVCLLDDWIEIKMREI
jgi:hypothetical protein